MKAWRLTLRGILEVVTYGDDYGAQEEESGVHGRSMVGGEEIGLEILASFSE